MATTLFLEPGGDADFGVNTVSATVPGFWGTVGAVPAVATDFVNSTHIKSIKYRTSNSDYVKTNATLLPSTGACISFWIYLNALPSGDTYIFKIWSASFDLIGIKVRTTGALAFYDPQAGTQIGTDGTTLSTGTWYRLSLPYSWTSSTVNAFKLFVNGTQSISVTNYSLGSAQALANWQIGNILGDANLDMRSSDHYTDNSTNLIDPGNIYVTAKRPNANGTTNGFSTQIGAGGSGYGTGHSPQVNERPLSTTNGWSMVGAGSAVTEEYNIEGKSVGDINISAATIVDWLGWVSIKSLVGETISVILNGTTVSQAITSTITLYTKIKGSTTYPSGTGADIGVITDTSLTTVSLYECGVIVAYIPSSSTSNLPLLGVG